MNKRQKKKFDKKFNNKRYCYILLPRYRSEVVQNFMIKFKIPVVAIHNGSHKNVRLYINKVLTPEENIRLNALTLEDITKFGLDIDISFNPKVSKEDIDRLKMKDEFMFDRIMITDEKKPLRCATSCEAMYLD